jgi:hypothetical protein
MILDVHLVGWSAHRGVLEGMLGHFGDDHRWHGREGLDLPANMAQSKGTDGTD